MLIISRKPGESLFIGRDILITILSGYDGEIRLGIEVPKHIEVMRKERIVDRDLTLYSAAVQHALQQLALPKHDSRPWIK